MVLDTTSFVAAVGELTGRDVRLARLVDEHGLPDFWHRPPGFRTLVLFILEQQVSLASARAAFERLEEGTGGVTPRRILTCSDIELRSYGFSRQKIRYVHALAEEVARGSLDLAALASRPDDNVREALTRVPGIGPWTADVYMLSCLCRPDVWPVGDRALQVAVAETLGLESVPSPDELARIGRRWAPWRSVAARLLWHGYLSRRGRAEPDPS